MYEKLNDVEWLKEHYVEKFRTLQSIADEIGCNKTTVQRALRKNDIERRKRTPKVRRLADREWLEQAYVKDRRSLNDIANELNTTPGNVAEHMQQAGIQRRSIKEAIELIQPNGRFGANASNWQGGRRIQDGYVYIYAPEHPYAAKGKPYIQEHRLVMEQILGRYLEPYEVVHHVDGDRKNNAPTNLVVKTRGRHVSEHFKASHEVLQMRQRVTQLEAENAKLKAEIERLRNECS